MCAWVRTLFAFALQLVIFAFGNVGLGHFQLCVAPSS